MRAWCVVGVWDGLLVGVVPVLMVEQRDCEMAAAWFDSARTIATTRPHRPDPRWRKAMAVALEGGQRLTTSKSATGKQEGFIVVDGRGSRQRDVPLKDQSVRDPHKGKHDGRWRSGGRTERDVGGSRWVEGRRRRVEVERSEVMLRGFVYVGTCSLARGGDRMAEGGGKCTASQ